MHTHEHVYMPQKKQKELKCLLGVKYSLWWD